MAKPKLNLASFTGVVEAAARPTTPPDAEIDLALIDVQKQVRSKLGDMTDLVAGIKAQGIIQPVVLLAKDDGRFRLIAGERRCRAAYLAGLIKVPAIIKKGLSEFEIRLIQVAENNDRENLSPYDEAIGVAEDVENFGFKEAIRIWNRSEAWVSKRTAVKKYADPVRDVLSEGLCGDLEVLHSLNQLYALNIKEYEVLVHRLRSGVAVTRDDARNKVSAVKTWKNQGAERANAVEVEKTNSIEESDGDNNLAASLHITEPGLEKPKSKAKKNKTSEKKSNKANPPIDSKAAAADHDRAKVALHALRAELMEWGEVNRGQFDSIQAHIKSLNFELAEGEWVLWTGFLDTVLPMLVSLGKDRGVSYLKRLQGELKGKDALTMWSDLHPTEGDQENDDTIPVRVPVVEMPKGWHF